MPTVIAIGTSSGGQKALKELLSHLKQDFPAALMVVSHLYPHQPSRLPEILARVTSLQVVPATHGETVQHGYVYLAVPDRHLMLVGDQIRLTRGPKENASRPAIDVLFRSCALSLGTRAIGVVLTGQLDDGTAGLWAIKDAHGQAIVQLPEDAEFPSMPQSVLKHVVADYVTRLRDMPAVFLEAVREPQHRLGGDTVSDKLRIETQIAQGRDALASGSLELGPPTELTCPDCGGVLSEIEEGSITRFRCHTGHAYSAQTLSDGTDERIDELLWQALRATDERTLILRRQAAAANASGNSEAIEHWQRRIEENRQCGNFIRSLLQETASLGKAEK